MYLSNKWYNILKWVAQYALPGLATAYFALSGIWGFPYTEEIVGTIVALSVFLGSLVTISNLQHKEDLLLNSSDQASMRNVDEGSWPFTMPSTTYDKLKWVLLIFLPAGGTLYFGLSQFWGFPYGQEVVGTIASLTALLGVMLGISTAKYNKAL